VYLCGASAFTSCSNNDDNPVVDNRLAEKIVGKWIHADTDAEVVELTAVTVSGDDLRFTALFMTTVCSTYVFISRQMLHLPEPLAYGLGIACLVVAAVWFTIWYNKQERNQQ
jgi:hypothetical protein